jgi:ribosomal protein S18 acetylase RimI-like enzyme
MPLTSRAYAGIDDLREMQSIVTAAWLSERRPLVSCTIGDLAWWLAGGGPGVDWPARIRIWTDGGRTVGWGWVKPPSDVDWFVAADVDEADERSVRAEIIRWAVEALALEAAGPDAPPPKIEAWGADGWLESDLLTGLGFEPTDTTLTQYFRPLRGDLPEPAVPAGYAIRAMAGPEEIAARVEVHRAAFAPSRMTVEKYELLVALDDYAYERDVVAVAPDGRFAAFTMCWLDRRAEIGEFEPVGTHPDHQRRGLGKAVNAFGLRRLREAGAREAIVFSVASNAASEALYQSVGFRPIAVHRAYTRPATR